MLRPCQSISVNWSASQITLTFLDQRPPEGREGLVREPKLEEGFKVPFADKRAYQLQEKL
jgi:hypothetical protein